MTLKTSNWTIKKSGSPSRADVHVNRPLTDISIAYVQSQDSFVAWNTFPVITVGKQSDRYFEYDRGFFNRSEMGVRAPSSESRGMNFAIDNTPTYYCPINALHIDIDDEMNDNSDEGIDLERDAATILSLQTLIFAEKQFAANYFKTGVWANDVTGVSASPGAGEVLQWDNPSSSPIEDVRTAKTTIRESTGFEPNKLVLGRRVWDKLVDHPDIVGRIDRGQTSGVALVNRQAVAALFEVDSVEVMSAIENTAAEGAANSHSFIGGKKAMLAYSNPNPSKLMPSAGYTFAWKGRGPRGFQVSRYRMDPIKSNRIEVEASFQMKKVGADLGYFWDTIVA